MKMDLQDLLLKKRSKEKELLDLGPEFYTLKEYKHCQKILFKINKLLGFFYNTKRFLKQFHPNISVLDVGCGGGLFVLNLSRHCPQISFNGCDISQDAIEMADEEAQNYSNHKVSFNLQKQLTLNLPENSVDVVLATLVCHHIEDQDLGDFFQQALMISREAVLLNDLHRHIIPYCFYKLFSPIFRNRLINKDGLISIKRGFTRKEWRLLLDKANIDNFTIKWRFPFCWSVVLWKK